MNELNKELEKAISSYDFEAMIELLKKGATPDDMIMHRIINKDRVDLLDYVLFSKELPINLPLHYDNVTEEPAFLYACMSRASHVLDYLLNNEKVCDLINFAKYAQAGFENTVRNQDAQSLELLLKHNKTRKHINLDNNMDYIKLSIKRSMLSEKTDALEYLVATQDIDFAHKIIKLIHPDSYYHQGVISAYQQRVLNENISNINIKNNTFKI